MRMTALSVALDVVSVLFMLCREIRRHRIVRFTARKLKKEGTVLLIPSTVQRP